MALFRHRETQPHTRGEILLADLFPEAILDDPRFGKGFARTQRIVRSRASFISILAPSATVEVNAVLQEAANSPYYEGVVAMDALKSVALRHGMSTVDPSIGPTSKYVEPALDIRFLPPN